MRKKRKNTFTYRLKNLGKSLLGNPLRVILLMLSDLVWSFSVLLLTFWLLRTLIPEMSGLVIIGWDFGEIAGMIVIINCFTKCYHGNVLNPGAAINRMEEIRRLSFAVFVSYLLGYLSWQLKGHIYPLPVVLFSFACTVLGFPVIRFLIRFCMKRAKIGQRRVFIAGAGNTAMSVGEELEISAYYGYEVVGYFDDDISKKNLCFHGKKWLGRICDAPRMAKKYQVHSIICCVPPIMLPRITQSYTRTFEHVLVIPSNGVLPITAVYPTLIGFISGFEYQNRILFPGPRIFKRLAEWVISIFCVVLLMPLFGILAILVKLSSPGPIFYTANRLGLGGRKIKVFKFRTMYQDADERLETLLEENPKMKEEWERKFKLYDDPRITKIGHFLRKTSLDELPQFINVMRGEMAIIGPRPIVQDEVKYYRETYEFFKRVRPGITGLWQVSGRSSTSYEKRVAMDMFYVMNWSFWLDWYILWKTVLVVAIHRGSC